MKISPLILLILIAACKHKIDPYASGYDYPKNISSQDTNFYTYQLKELNIAEDPFGIDYEYLFLRPFGEPNLSIMAQPTETYRLVYSIKNIAFIISMTQYGITVKTGDASDLYDGEKKYSKKEKHDYYIMDMLFNPRSENSRNIHREKLDSLVKIDPKLSNINYYRSLVDKKSVRNAENFEYELKKIPITKIEFDSIANEIKDSEFWSLPAHWDCRHRVEGSGLTLEANTKTKYKIVSDLYCAGSNSKIMKVCDNIIALADIDIEKLHDKEWIKIIVPSPNR